jgi:uncharacterized protein YdaT
MMPWSSPSAFAKKHNKKLKGKSASVAQRMANAMLRKGVPEGEAIATANKKGDSVAKSYRNPFGSMSRGHKH